MGLPVDHELSRKAAVLAVALAIVGVTVVGCGTNSVQGTAREGSMSPTSPTSVSDPVHEGSSVTSANLEACSQAIGSTPLWAGTDRTAPSTVQQVSDGSMGRIEGTLRAIEAGPVEASPRQVPDDVVELVPGGLKRGFTRFLITADEVVGTFDATLQIGDEVGVLVPTVEGSDETVSRWEDDGSNEKIAADCPPGIRLVIYVSSAGSTEPVDVHPTGLAGIMMQTTDGNIRSLDPAVTGPEPFGIATISKF